MEKPDTQPDLTARIDERLAATEGHTPALWVADYVGDNAYLISSVTPGTIDGNLRQIGLITHMPDDACMEDAALIASAPTLRALLVEARAQIAAQAEALVRAEWGGSQRGAPYGSMWHNTPGPLIPACPICGGVHPEKGKREFNSDALGHRPTCPFAALGVQS